MLERRRRRSVDPQEALSIFLDAQVNQRGAVAMACARLDGSALGDAGEADADVLAEAGARRLRGRSLEAYRIELGDVDLIDAVIVDFDGEPLVVATQGGARPLPGELDGHVRRILAA